MEKIINKITDFIIVAMTILSPIFFFVGVFGADTPDTAIPEILMIISLAWFGFIIYCCNGKDTEEAHGKNR